MGKRNPLRGLGFVSHWATFSVPPNSSSILWETKWQFLPEAGKGKRWLGLRSSESYFTAAQIASVSLILLHDRLAKFYFCTEHSHFIILSWVNICSDWMALSFSQCPYFQRKLFHRCSREGLAYTSLAGGQRGRLGLLGCSRSIQLFFPRPKMRVQLDFFWMGLLNLLVCLVENTLRFLTRAHSYSLFLGSF